MTARWEQKRYLTIDAETGEVMEGAMVSVGRKVRWREDYFMTFQDKIEELSEDEELTGRTWRVLAALLGKLGWENWLHISQADLAKKLNMHRPDVSRAMKILVEKGVIIRGPKMGRSHAYKLNSNFGFKGKLTDLTAYRMREKSHLSVVSEGDDPNQMPLPLFDK